MEIIIAYPYLVRLIWMTVTPAIASLITIVRISKLSRSAGDVYYSGATKPIGEILILLGIILLTSLIVSPRNFSQSLIVPIVILIGYMLSSMERIVESLKTGIYENLIVNKGFSCKWDEVEGVIFGQSKIRFIHKEKGAFDFNLHQPKINEMKERILKQTNEIEGEI